MDLGYVKGLDLTVVVENKVMRRDLLAEHGLSLFLQVKESSGDTYSYFFDAGQTDETLKNNLELLKVPLKDVKGIIISHGHYDHTGGLLALIEAIPHQVKLIGHKYLFKPKIYHERNKPVREIGMPFSQKYVESLKITPYYISKPKVISEGVGVITEIPTKYQFEINTHFITKVTPNREIPTHVEDVALVVNVENVGAIVITGCGHAGILNTIEYAKDVFNLDNIYAVLGGFHMRDSNETRISTTIQKFEEFGISAIFPMHCTGIHTTCRFVNEFKAGKTYILHTGAGVAF